jgi:Recombinase zinc beta ribbon domain
VDRETFDAVQERLAGGVHAPVRRQRATPHPYVLRGLITCARCGRRMQGSWRQTRAYYQCRLADPAEYARSRELEADHPRSAYVREDRITTHIDTWLAQLFDPDHIEQTIAELTQPFADDPVPPRAEALGAADGTRKGDLLSNLGVLVSYDPLTRRARVTCRPKK